MNIKKEIKRCQRCKKKSLIDIQSEPQQINPHTIRSFVGVQCVLCGWSDKIYTYKDVEKDRI
jgi:RNase P subunit RPR2